MRTPQLLAAVLLAALLAVSVPQTGWAAPATLSAVVRPAGAGAQVVLSASAPFRFTLRHLRGPDRLVVDLSGLAVGTIGGGRRRWISRRCARSG